MELDMLECRMVLMPTQLCKLANKAKEDMAPVELSAQQVQDIADWWHQDKEKIHYLESLLLRRN